MGQQKKNVFWLGIVSFFTDVSSEMIFPVLPIFLRVVLGANMAIVGMIEGVAEATASLLKLFSGWLSDKMQKKKLLVGSGYGLSAFTKPILALASSWWHVLFVRVSDRVGKGIRTAPRDALIAASVSKEERGKYFGLHRMLDTSGAILGSLIAAVLLYIYTNDFRLIFWLSFIPGLIAVVILYLFVVDVKDEVKKKVEVSFKNLNPDYRNFLIVVMLFGLGNFSYAFFLLRAQDIGLVVALIPVIYLVYNLVYAGISIPAGKLSDKIGRKKVLFFSYIMFAITSLGFGFYADLKSIWLLFVLYGLFMALNDGVSRAYVSDMVDVKRGSALGAYHMVVGIVVLPANFIGGYLWNSFSVEMAFVYGAVMASLASLYFLLGCCRAK
jgi:MFS family permease